MTQNETKNWISDINDVVNSYNSRHHSTIKMSPNPADLAARRNKAIENLSLYYNKRFEKPKQPQFKIGDIVSIQKLKGVFAKGYEKMFTEELFIIKKIHTKLPIPQYTLGEYSGKNTLEGRFYENELQKADYEVFKIEQILGRRQDPVSGEKEIFVKLVRWPDKYNQWVSESLVQRDYAEDRDAETSNESEQQT